MIEFLNYSLQQFNLRQDTRTRELESLRAWESENVGIEIFVNAVYSSAGKPANFELLSLRADKPTRISRRDADEHYVLSASVGINFSSC